MLTDDAQLFSRPKEMNLFVTDCKYGLTETDVKHRNRSRADTLVVLLYGAGSV